MTLPPTRPTYPELAALKNDASQINAFLGARRLAEAPKFYAEFAMQWDKTQNVFRMRPLVVIYREAQVDSRWTDVRDVAVGASFYEIGKDVRSNTPFASTIVKFATWRLRQSWAARRSGTGAS